MLWLTVSGYTSSWQGSVAAPKRDSLRSIHSQEAENVGAQLYFSLIPVHPFPIQGRTLYQLIHFTKPLTGMPKGVSPG